MRVLHINKLYYPHIGGIEKHVRDLAESMQDQVDLEVLVANTGPSRSVETINGVKVTRVPSWGVARSAPIAPGFYRQIRRSSADIFHLHFPNPTGELAYLAAGSPGALVITYQSDIIRQKLLRLVYRPFLKRLLKRADLILTSSPNMISSSPWLSSVSEKCRVVPLGIDPDIFRLNDDISARASEVTRRFKPPVVLFIGRLIYYKGLEYLIEAMGSVDANLVIVGEGDQEPRLRKLTEERRLTGRVHFVGTVSDQDLPAYYYASDLFVLPSTAESEAYGFVQLEAHACAVPVVSTDLPTGVPFVNQHNSTGLVVPPRDSKALARAINQLLKDDALRKKLGAQAKKRVQSEFNLKTQADKVLSVYREALSMTSARNQA